MTKYTMPELEAIGKATQDFAEAVDAMFPNRTNERTSDLSEASSKAALLKLSSASSRINPSVRTDTHNGTEPSA